MKLNLPISMRLICLFLFLFASACSAVHVQDDVSTRAQRREIIPLDKLKVLLEAPKRVQTMQLERVLDVLAVKGGETVADIGAGTGFFSFPLAGMVGATGKVYAVEIEDELLDFMRDKMERRNVTNIVLVKSSDSGPNLPSACCDKILVANTYIYFDQPVAFMKNLRPALKPGGLVGIIEVDEDKARSEKKLLLRSKGRFVSEVIDEMKAAGFVLRESHDFIESRFFLVFE